jgi:hypothetical protein
MCTIEAPVPSLLSVIKMGKNQKLEMKGKTEKDKVYYSQKKKSLLFFLSRYKLDVLIYKKYRIAMSICYLNQRICVIPLRVTSH